jgi:hypothetical protein
LGALSWISSNGVRLVFGEYPYVKWVYESIKQDNHVPMGFLKWTNEMESEKRTFWETRKTSTRASWLVMPWSSSSMRPWYNERGVFSGGIEAYEKTENRVRVDFLDGYSPEDPKIDYPSIGQPFIEFIDMLVGELMSEEGSLKGDENSKLNPLTTEIMEILIDRFNEEELRTFCIYLQVDFENLPGRGKIGKARELVLHFERRGELDFIVNVGAKYRQDINWPIV